MQHLQTACLINVIIVSYFQQKWLLRYISFDLIIIYQIFCKSIENYGERQKSGRLWRSAGILSGLISWTLMLARHNPTPFNSILFSNSLKQIKTGTMNTLNKQTNVIKTKRKTCKQTNNLYKKTLMLSRHSPTPFN